LPAIPDTPVVAFSSAVSVARRCWPWRVPVALVVAVALGASGTFALSGCARAAPDAFRYRVPPDARQAPEGASGWTDKPGWHASRLMVAAANPLAADAGYQILQAGGSAVDAAIAVQMVLTLVEPQSSGIGGGAFLLHWDGARVQELDGRETAPAAATPDLFLRDGEPMPLAEAIASGRSVGVPGALRMLAAAHREHGQLPWATLFEPAIALAEQGFAISPRLAMLLAGEQALARDAEARAYFYTADGLPKSAGTVLRNPALAAVLREIAAGGADVFYTGAIAREVVSKVRAHPTAPGVLTMEDMAGYQPVEREPLCFEYRVARICGFPPPGTGTVALAQILGMLEPRDLAALPPVRDAEGRWLLDPEAVHLYTEAARLAYADRDAYVGDPDFVGVPVAGLVDPAYVRSRAALIGPRSMGQAAPGVPPGAMAGGRDRSPERPSTSHISVVDAGGRAVSMTTTIEDGFGSRQMVRGFLLNNQLTDFSLVPTDAEGRLVANRVAGGKRPRSSMTPLLVFDRGTGHLTMTIGSPGGSAIINYVGKALIGTVDWGLNVQQAIALPNFGSRNGPTELEAGQVGATLVAALEARGHVVRLMPQTSGIQGIQWTATGWFGGADPRREGIARGE
jgi:gamma-glutamyltranspeptidase / glutathione hydrolase